MYNVAPLEKKQERRSHVAQGFWAESVVLDITTKLILLVYLDSRVGSCRIFLCIISSQIPQSLGIGMCTCFHCRVLAWWLDMGYFFLLGDMELKQNKFLPAEN
ncbi:hypothetical protein IFM89_010791 [Coptis chinensis]|uniref:Uncharacterized protein n=1 Tax=Coptis chinensis TaxID=261450 RepID=A0A835IPU8_9MAGN|nr:hypothetical protein IFM89_010791 [Coptis chinensis]